MSRWVLPVPLLPDEIISSWLVRAALTQGCDPLVLTGEVWPKWRIWTRDADRFLADERIEPLCELSGITKETLRAATLSPVASQILGGNLPKNAIWPWILALGERNTKRHGGLQYCPICLAEDAKPYYRRQWRFAWHIGCGRHSCSLLDRCHACNAPVEPHRLLAEDQNVAVCATCKADLRNATPDPCLASALAFQCMADQVVFHGQGMFHGQAVDVFKWFELVSFFEALIRRASRSRTETLSAFLHQLGVKLPEGLPVIAGAGIELLRTNERQELLQSIHPLMMVNQERFEFALRESGISLQGFCAKGETLPKVIKATTTSLLDKPRIRTKRSIRKLTGPRPRHEVIRMMARLQRKLEMMKR